MGHPRANLSRRGRALLWADQHPLTAHGLVVLGGLFYLWATLGLSLHFA